MSKEELINGIMVKGRKVFYRFYKDSGWQIDIDGRKYIETMIKGGAKQGGLLNEKGFWILDKKVIRINETNNNTNNQTE